MTKDQITALANAFSALNELATNPISHSQMKIVMKPIFEDFERVGIPHELIMHYDRMIASHYVFSVYIGNKELIDKLKSINKS